MASPLPTFSQGVWVVLIKWDVGRYMVTKLYETKAKVIVLYIHG